MEILVISSWWMQIYSIYHSESQCCAAFVLKVSQTLQATDCFYHSNLSAPNHRSTHLQYYPHCCVLSCGTPGSYMKHKVSLAYCTCILSALTNTEVPNLKIQAFTWRAKYRTLYPCTWRIDESVRVMTWVLLLYEAKCSQSTFLAASGWSDKD